MILIAAAVAARQPWLDRHFLPSFFLPRPWYVGIERGVRAMFFVLGLALVFRRSRLTRIVTDAPMLSLQVCAAAILAVVASEAALRWMPLRPTEWLAPEEEPKRQPDAELGWVLTPARVGHSTVGGRMVEYAIDSAGDRVRGLDEPVDRLRPTIVFAGESAMFGEGLTWEESIPAQAAAIAGLQSANIAVHGYATDQIYLRLARELPRFQRPVAVIAIFMTELFGRNLDHDRPHLAPGLVWRPPQQTSRLAALATLIVPYRRDATVDAGVALTREALLAMVHLAQSRGATPLVVIPQFGLEDAAQRALRQRIVTDGVPSVLVPLDPGWRLPWDRHPNPRAAHAIAAAVAARLR